MTSYLIILLAISFPGYRKKHAIYIVFNHYLNYQQKSGVETVAIWTYGSDELPEGEDENKDIYRFLEADKIFNETQKRK